MINVRLFWQASSVILPSATRGSFEKSPQNTEERSAFTLISHLVLCKIPHKTFVYPTIQG